MRPIIYEKLKLDSVPANVESIHIARPISYDKFKKLLGKTKRLKDITMSESTFKRLGTRTKKLLEDNRIILKKRSNAGRAISINLELLLELIEYQKYGDSIRQISEEFDLPKSTIHYLFKYAKRNKFYLNKRTIILEWFL